MIHNMIKGGMMYKPINYQCDNFPNLQLGLDLINIFGLQVRCQDPNQANASRLIL